MTALHWDFGSAYDFFVSLFVIHHPDRFGLRPAWAAGVRSRLSLEEREFMEEAINFFPVPLSWINQLPLEEKNTQNVLDFITSIPPEKRLISLYKSSQLTDEVLSTINRIQESQTISADDLEVLRTLFQRRTTPIKTRDIQKMAEVFLDPVAFGERLLKVLQDYYEVFFAEEEERILPALREGLVVAQKQAVNQTYPELIEASFAWCQAGTYRYLSENHADTFVLDYPFGFL